MSNVLTRRPCVCEKSLKESPTEVGICEYLCPEVPGFSGWLLPPLRGHGQDSSNPDGRLRFSSVSACVKRIFMSMKWT